MSIELPLHRMTTAEKLDAMEAIWADLTRNAAGFETPAWHQEVLEDRKAAVEEGKACYADWDDALERLKKSGHENPDPRSR